MRHFGDLDLSVLAEAVARPGIDPRIWVSYGIVNREQDDQHSVEFDPDWGPLVSVILQPHNQLISCRVSSQIAGNGEGEWHPFLEGDEVLVVVPEGDTRTGPVIIGRLNNALDKFPEKVAGKETNLNNVGFIRRRGPFIIEGDSMMIMRSATTGAMIGVDEIGNATLRDGEGNVFQIGANGIAMQNKDGDAQISLDFEKRRAAFGFGSSVLQLNDGATSKLVADGALEISASGNSPVEHLVTLEQLVNILASLLTNVTTGAGMGFLVGPPGTGFPDRLTALSAISAALSGIAYLPIEASPATPTNAALILQAVGAFKPPPVPSPGGAFVQPFPGVGCSGLKGA